MSLYFLLHSFNSNRYSFNKNDKQLDYYENIGLNIRLHWIGSIMTDVLFSYIPFICSIIIVKLAFLFFQFDT